MSVNYNKTPHDKLVDILFNTPETPEQKKQKKILMILRIINDYHQRKKYIDYQYKIFDAYEKTYIKYLLEEYNYNYVPSNCKLKDNYIITIEDMLSGVFT